MNVDDKPKVTPGTRRKNVERAKRQIKWALAALFAGAFFTALVLPIGGLIAAGRGAANRLGAPQGNALQKIERARSMRRYALTPDSSIEPMRAGEALVSLGAREGDKPKWPARRAARGPYSLPIPDPTLFPDARPVEWRGPSWTKVLLVTKRGLTNGELDYLASLAANPIWEEYAIVARAPRMDLAGAMYETPFDDTLAIQELPILRFAGTKEIAYANVSRAAWHVANNRVPAADTVLRETIGNGLRLIEDGNSLVDHLVGVALVDIGRRSLEQLYELTGNPELDSLRADSAVVPRAASPALTTEALAAAIADSTLPRGVRIELILSSNASVCTSVGGLFRGTPKAIDEATAVARSQIVRTEAEGHLFDLAVHVLDRPHHIRPPSEAAGFGKLIMTTARFPALLFGKPRLANCATMLAH